MRGIMVLVCLFFAGCSLEAVDGSGGGGGGGDGSGGGGGGGGGGGANQSGFFGECVDIGTPGLSSHNPGTGCMNGGCHDGTTPPTMTVAGTLYDAASGGNTVAGGTVHLEDSAGNPITLITGSTGNFYSTDPIAFPVKAGASSCPSAKEMSNMVTQNGGNCAQSGCHVAGMRIFVEP